MRTLKPFTGLCLLTTLLCLVMLSCSSSRRASGSSSGAGNSETPSTSIQRKFGTLIGVPPAYISDGVLYSFIDKWLNTSYKYGSQNDKEIDCSGFTQILYDAVYKKKLPRTSEAQYNSAFSKIGSLKNLQEGDLVFFTTSKGKKISHVGVYLQNNRFVNATTKGVLISDMNLPYWKDSYVGGGRY